MKISREWSPTGGFVNDLVKKACRVIGSKMLHGKKKRASLRKNTKGGKEKRKKDEEKQKGKVFSK